MECMFWRILGCSAVHRVPGRTGWMSSRRIAIGNRRGRRWIARLLDLECRLSCIYVLGDGLRIRGVGGRMLLPPAPPVAAEDHIGGFRHSKADGKRKPGS